MRVLITNDDGVREPGLIALLDRLIAGGYDVLVAGPSAQCSGSGASLGVVEHAARVPVRRVTLTGREAVPVYAVEAPPALAVRAACTGAFGPTPDVVLSGINPGYNVGRLVFHSGTVGAALTAASLDICGISVSTAATSDRGFRSAAEVGLWSLEAVADTGLPAVAVNVNVPDLDLSDLTSVEHSTLEGESIAAVEFLRGMNELVIRRTWNEPPFLMGTDSFHLSNGSVSVSSIPLPWRPWWDPAELISRVRNELP